MRQNSRLFRLAGGVALGIMLCNTLLPVAAVAQAAPSEQEPGDPPARVGRIARLTGTVSYRTASDTQWSQASTNYPVSSGDAFWTEPSAEVSLETAASRVALAPQTEFDITTLDSSGLQAVLPQGEVYLRLADLAADEVWSVHTPRGQVRMGSAGRYAVVAGTTEQPTLVTVLEGAAEIDGPGISLRLAANETATITGGDPFQGSVGPALRDAFLTANLSAERPLRPAPLPPPVMAQVAAMPGGEDLTTTGTWAEAPQYGQVWYPPVSPGWVPYRQGHWAYIQPWGWTWIDDAPWGFAPFHYGRWAQINDRWCWIPGERAVVAEPPVYAPALVTFFGIGAAVAVGAAFAGGTVGWVPLGPRERYRPWYHASDRYVRRVNDGREPNVSVTNNVTTVNNFFNHGAATSVPAAVMTGSRPVQGAAHPLAPDMLASAHPVFGQQPIRPTARTLGVTPAAASQLHLAPAGPEGFRAAPGPPARVRPAAAGEPPRPPLAGGQPGAASRPGPAEAGPAAIQASPHPGPAGAGPIARPETQHGAGAPPALVTPGTRPPGVPAPFAPGSASPNGQSPARPAPGSGTPRGTQPAGVPTQPGPAASGPTPGRPALTGEGPHNPRPASVPFNPAPGPGSGATPARPAAPNTPPPGAHTEGGVRPGPMPGQQPHQAMPSNPASHPAAPPVPMNHPGPVGAAPRFEPPSAMSHPAPAAPVAHAAPPPPVAMPAMPRPAPPAAPHFEAPRPAAPRMEPPRVEAPRPGPPPAPHAEPPGHRPGQP